MCVDALKGFLIGATGIVTRMSHFVLPCSGDIVKKTFFRNNAIYIYDPMRWLTLFLSLLIPTLRAYTQQEKELLRALNHAATDSARFHIYRDLGYLFELSDSARAMTYYRKEKEIADRLSDSRLLSMAWLDFGSVQYHAGEFERALLLYKKSKHYAARENETARMGTACLNIANTFHQLFETDSAAYYALKAVEYQLISGDSTNLGITFANLAAYYEDMGQLDMALKYVEESYVISQKTGDIRGVLGASSTGAVISTKMGDRSARKRYLQRLESLTPSAEDPALKCQLYQNLGGIYNDAGEYAKGNTFADSALHYLRGMESSELAPAVWMIKGIALLKSGDAAGGADWLERALSRAERLGDWMVAREVHLELADYHAADRRFEKAFYHHQKYTQFKDSTYQELVMERASELNARYRLEKQQLELDKLSRENELNALKVSTEKKKRWVIIVVGLLALSVMGLSLLALRRKVQLSLEQEKVQQEQIRRLESEKQVTVLDSMLKGEENERSRVAKDLHDGVGSLLSGVKLSLDSMKGTMIIHEHQARIFEKSLEQLDHAIQEMRRVAHNMMPETLVSSGLLAATDFFIRSIAESGLIAIHFEHHNFDERLSADHEIVLYRIIQELLNNSLKHSGSSEIIVQLNRYESTVNLVVEDNGKGFDPALWTSGSGMGFLNLKNRVNYLKGNIQLQTGPGQGTSYLIEFVIP